MLLKIVATSSGVDRCDEAGETRRLKANPLAERNWFDRFSVFLSSILTDEKQFGEDR
jgi:hypothetical protein